MVTIGCDVHLRTTTMTVLDHGGNKIARKKLENDPNQLLRFVRQFHGEKQLAMETCYNWPVFYELFKTEVSDFRLLHAKKLQSIIASQAKNDANDADEIAYLVHSRRPLTESYIADVHTRGFRRLLRMRAGFSLDVARIKNQIHALLNAHTFYSQRPRTFKDLFCKRGLAYLKTVDLPEQERFILDRSLDKIIELERRRDEFDERINSVKFHHKDLKWLQTVPGMRGDVLKYIILAEIDNVHRFRHARRAHQLATDAVQDAVHESARFVGAKPLGDFNGFIDGDHRRHVRAIEHFVNRDAQNIPVHGSDAVEIVIGGRLADALVDVSLVRKHPLGDGHAKLAHFFGGGPQLPKILHRLGIGTDVEVALIQKLYGSLPAFSACSHRTKC